MAAKKSPETPEGWPVYRTARHSIRLVFRRRGEEAHGMIESRRRRAAEKQRIYQRAVYKQTTPPGFPLSRTKLGLIPSDPMAWVSSLTSEGKRSATPLCPEEFQSDR